MNWLLQHFLTRDLEGSALPLSQTFISTATEAKAKESQIWAAEYQ